MARMPALKPTLLFDPIHQKAEAAHREDGTNASAATIRLNLRDDLATESLPGLSSPTSKHSRQLLVGSPCLHCCSTKPSWPQTNPPSNLRNQHRNRTAWKTSRSRRLGSDIPCRGLCSTTPSLPLTNLLANSRNHRRSCTAH